MLKFRYRFKLINIFMNSSSLPFKNYLKCAARRSNETVQMEKQPEYYAELTSLSKLFLKSFKRLDYI